MGSRRVQHINTKYTLLNLFEIILGHEHVVEMLLVAKADPTLLMGDLSPLNIAKDFGHDSIHNLIKEYIKERS